jgi:hydrogenase maturation protein HypF
VAAEWGDCGPFRGLALDGIGFGPDGGLWGGELLALDLRPGTAPDDACRRLGHLAPLALPGGDQAAREPWRMAIAALHALGHPDIPAWLAARWPSQSPGPLLQMLDRGLRCPPTSSLGRVFDAAAGLLGVRAITAYEGQAAMELEALARQHRQRHGPTPPRPDGFRITTGDSGAAVLDLRPLLATLADERDAAAGAARFHSTLAAALENWLACTVDRGLAPPGPIYLAGGCAQNALLVADLGERLAARGQALRLPRQAPPNDGGLALGQAWWARCRASDVPAPD